MDLLIWYTTIVLNISTNIYSHEYWWEIIVDSQYGISLSLILFIIFWLIWIKRHFLQLQIRKIVSRFRLIVPETEIHSCSFSSLVMLGNLLFVTEEKFLLKISPEKVLLKNFFWKIASEKFLWKNLFWVEKNFS